MRTVAIALPLLLTPLALSFVASPPPTAAPASGVAELQIDPGHSTVVFRVLHAGAAPFYGRFNKIEGGMTFDPKALDQTEIDVRIDASSVDTASDKRDQHLRSPDFFDAKQFPSITFTGKKVREVEKGTYEVEGDLEMRGVKKPVTARVVHTGDGQMRGKALVGYEVKLTVKRGDFGVSYGIDGNALSDEVQITLGLEMVKS